MAFNSDGPRRGGFGGGRGGGGFRGGGFRGGGFRRDDGRPREMHKITCSECGKEDEVPFKPRQGTPVYCKDCFAKRSGRSFNRDSHGPQGQGSSSESSESEEM